MIYKNLNQIIPQDQRKEVNNKLLLLIDSNPNALTKEEFYNLYTGDGGLHGLNFKDYENFNSFTEAKKEIEQGQFFTPHDICNEMVNILQHKDGFIADISCGSGMFFNFFDNQYCYGTDIDLKAVKVAKFLYPNANIECQDIKYYNPKIKFDTIIGNPPFNLKWNVNNNIYLSQLYFVKKSAELLKPAGILMFICPESFLNDEFFQKTSIETVNKDFNFICQYKVDNKAFKNVGVENFATKVMIFQKVSDHLEVKPYKNEFVNVSDAFNLMTEVNINKDKIRAKITLEIARNTSSEFDFKIKKYLYEIKTHLPKYYTKALIYIEQFHNQKPSDNMSYEEWHKNHRITENKVLSYLKQIIKKQQKKEKRHEIKVIKFQYGYKIKGYDYETKKLVNSLSITQISKYEIIENGLPVIWKPFLNPNEIKTFNRTFAKLNKKYSNQLQNFKEVVNNVEIENHLNNFTFISKGIECRLNEIQKTDMNKILQKDYSILNFSMGTGKTPCSFAWSKFVNTRNVVITSAALAINLTWIPFLETNNVNFVNVKSIKDINNIKDGDYILLSLEYATKYKKQLKGFVKSKRNNISFIFDESDEITNNTSLRTKSILNIFRKSKRKLLATGTTTRNNISELYSQLELLYNNSYNMICECETIYKEDKKEKSLNSVDNKYYNKPFPAFKGALLFKRCFNPSKTTVFGIQQHNQDIYNEKHLRKLLEKSIITKSFKEIAGDKYSINTVLVYQKGWERDVYSKIITEFHSIANKFFKNDKNSRKKSMLEMLQKIDLLIRATSIPQIFSNESLIPSKFEKIKDMISEFSNEKVAIGCTSLIALTLYTSYIKSNFNDRKVFVIDGSVNFKKRQSIIKEFEDSNNGILICTQQSLKSSVNIPSCSKVIIESLQWNIPKIEQFYFRFIRFDSTDHTNVYFINYEGTIEMNLMALLMAKERLNDYIKTLEFKEQNEIFEDFGIDLSILDSLMEKEKDSEGKMVLKWGTGNLK